MACNKGVNARTILKSKNKKIYLQSKNARGVKEKRATTPPLPATLVPLQEGKVPLQSPSPGWAGSHPTHALVDAYSQAGAIPAPRSEVGSEHCPLCPLTTGTLYKQQALEIYGLPDSVECQITAQKDFLSP